MFNFEEGRFEKCEIPFLAHKRFDDRVFDGERVAISLSSCDLVNRRVRPVKDVGFYQGCVRPGTILIR